MNLNYKVSANILRVETGLESTNEVQHFRLEVLHFERDQSELLWG